MVNNFDYPKDWNIKSYEELFVFLPTATYSRDKTNSYGEVGYIHYGDIHVRFDDSLDLSKVDLPRISSDQAKKYPSLKDGDIIIVDASEDYTGVCESVLIKNPISNCISGLHTFLLRAKDNSLYTDFRAFLHRIPIVRNQMNRSATGMKVYGVSKSNLRKINIPFPDLKEQIEIAKTLGDMNNLIAITRNLIIKKEALKQGLMQELLTGKSRLTGYDDKWSQKKLGELIDVFRGGSPRPISSFITENANGINWIKIGDTDKSGKYITSCKEKIIPEGEANSRRVSQGDFLLSNSMSFGRPYLLKIEGCIHDGWLALQNYQDVFDSEFLYYLLSSEPIYNQYLRIAAGSGVLNLNKKLVESVVLYFPTNLDEQKAIAAIFSDCDEEIENLNQKLQKLTYLKNGMMQELLTGRIRLFPQKDEYDIEEDYLPIAAEIDNNYIPKSRE